MSDWPPNPSAYERPTPDSIARARAAQQAERRKVTRLTGVRFTEDGQPMTPWGLADYIEEGLRAAKFVAAAIFGARGEKRN